MRILTWVRVCFHPPQSVSAGGKILNVLSTGLHKHGHGFIKTQPLVKRLHTWAPPHLKNKLSQITIADRTEGATPKTSREKARSTSAEQIWFPLRTVWTSETWEGLQSSRKNVPGHSSECDQQLLSFLHLFSVLWKMWAVAALLALSGLVLLLCWDQLKWIQLNLEMNLMPLNSFCTNAKLPGLISSCQTSLLQLRIGYFSKWLDWFILLNSLKNCSGYCISQNQTH